MNQKKQIMDKISALPDFVLSHILSLLPTKLAVSICILSKRWQFLWTMVHNLDLDCEPHHELPKDLKKQIVKRFINFVTRFFTRRDKDLCFKKFRLKYMVPDFCSKHVDSWIFAAMSSGVEEFVIEIVLLDLHPFRCSVFTCKTLVILKLSGSVIVDVPSSSVPFPSLKLLHLRNVCFESPRSFSNLLSGCPVLENFEMYVIDSVDEFSDYVISSPTLRHLVIMFFDVTEEPIWLSLDTPSLKYLNLNLQSASKDIHLKNLDNLVEAILYLDCDEEDDLEYRRFPSMVKDALGALYNVRDLELVSSAMHAIRNTSFEGFPIFHNLVQLKLSSFCCYWRMLLSLVQKLPLLQHLIIIGGGCADCHISQPYLGSESWAELYVPNCLSRLRTLCLVGTR